MIIINIRLNPLGFHRLFTHDRDLHEIKIVYDHTHIASYRHLRVGNVGGEYGYWFFLGNECCAAGGFPSNPIQSGSLRSAGVSTFFFRCTVEGSRSKVGFISSFPGGVPLFFWPLCLVLYPLIRQLVEQLHQQVRYVIIIFTNSCISHEMFC
jgi:hypothetical protein